MGSLENGEIALRARNAIGGVTAEPWAPSSDQEQPGRGGTPRWSQQSPQDHLTFPKSWLVDAPSSSQDLPRTLSPTHSAFVLSHTRCVLPPLGHFPAPEPLSGLWAPLPPHTACSDLWLCLPWVVTLIAAGSLHPRVTGTAPASGGDAPLQGAAVPKHMASSCTPHLCPRELSPCLTEPPSRSGSFQIDVCTFQELCCPFPHKTPTRLCVPLHWV